MEPHFFRDSVRRVDAVEGISAFLAGVDGTDTVALRAATDACVVQLTALDADVEALIRSIPAPRRVLVNTHEVFGYFADRYGMEVVGTMIPAGTTTETASASALAELAELIDANSVPAIFADTSAPDELAKTLASEGGDIEIVELFSESLREPGSGGATCLEMIRTNAERMAIALA